jgi:hypothetical protein
MRLSGCLGCLRMLQIVEGLPQDATLTRLLTSAVGDQHPSRYPYSFGCNTTSSPVASALPVLLSALRSLALATPIRVTPGSPGPCTAALSVLSCLSLPLGPPCSERLGAPNSSWIANALRHDLDASQLIEHPCTMSGGAVGNYRIEIILVGYTTHRQ